jgi:hypothetical protein
MAHWSACAQARKISAVCDTNQLWSGRRSYVKKPDSTTLADDCDAAMPSHNVLIQIQEDHFIKLQMQAILI